MCVLVVLGLFVPRLALVLLWLFSDYLSTAFGSWLIPLLGFFFLPTTTIAAAYSIHAYGGISGFGLVLTILGLLIDLGVFSGGARSRRRS